MKSENVISLCAAIVALCSLSVSIFEARATRRHNRNSVRPILQLHRIWHHEGGRTGVRLSNRGLGPAIVTSSKVWIDGGEIGPWKSENVGRLRDELTEQPSYVTFNDEEVITTEFDKHLLSIPSYESEQHADFGRLIRDRIRIEIWYESLYGGEGFHTAMIPKVDDLPGPQPLPAVHQLLPPAGESHMPEGRSAPRPEHNDRSTDGG